MITVLKLFSPFILYTLYPTQTVERIISGTLKEVRYTFLLKVDIPLSVNQYDVFYFYI